MTPLEYLIAHLDKKYHPYKDTIVQTVTKDYEPPFKLPNGEIYCTGSWTIGKRHVICVVNNKCDGCIYRGLPNQIFYKTYNPSINTLGQWISDSIFQFMLDSVEFNQNKTELVRLRIAVNQIFKLDYLSAHEKIQWSDWIKELYWNRKAVLNKWYIDEVLPF